MAGPWERYRQQGAQPVQISAPDPRLPAQVQGEQLGNQRTQQQIQADQQMLPLQIQKAQADAAIAQANARKAANAPTVDPKMAQREANLRAMQNQINRVQQLYKAGPGATSGLSGLLDYLPTPENKQFDTAGAGLAELGLAAFRVPGVGSQSDAELRAFVEANKPRSTDYDVQIQEKLRNLQNRLMSARNNPAAPKQPARRPKPKQSKVIDFNDLPE